MAWGRAAISRSAAALAVLLALGASPATFVPVRITYNASPKPLIRGTFAGPVELKTLKIVLDGVDITRPSTRWSTGFAYRPRAPLTPKRHDVEVFGTLRDGDPVSVSYQFTTGSDVPAAPLPLAIESPADGSTVPLTFVVAGRSAPNARIHVTADVDAAASGVYAADGNAFAGDQSADATGAFAVTVRLASVGGVKLNVEVLATDPLTNRSAEKRLHLTGS